MIFEVIAYEDVNGKIPVQDFLKQLTPKMRAKMYGMLEILQEKGSMLREPYSKYIEDGIFELRCKFGSDITRVMYFFYYDRKIVLTNGFIKKTQKTPQEEIQIAKKRRIDFIERMAVNEMLSEEMKNDEFRKEYEAIQPELDVIRAMVDARNSVNMTQKELSERTGISQADISKIENGTRNPSLNLLKRLAEGMGMTLKIEFVPKYSK